MSEVANPPKHQILFTRKQAAELLGTSPDTIKRLERQGKLHRVRLTTDKGQVFLRADELYALAEGGIADG